MCPWYQGRACWYWTYGTFRRRLAYGKRHLEEGLEKGIEQGLEKGIDQGIEQGIEQGLEQGLEQGIEQGIEKNQLDNIVKLMKKLSLTEEEAMDMLDIAEENRRRYHDILKK